MTITSASSADSISWRIAFRRLSMSFHFFIRKKVHTEGSLSISKHKLKSGPDTVAARALMSMLMITSGLLCWGLNWYLNPLSAIYTHSNLHPSDKAQGFHSETNETTDEQFKDSEVAEQIVLSFLQFRGKVVLHERQVWWVVSVLHSQWIPLAKVLFTHFHLMKSLQHSPTPWINSWMTSGLVEGVCHSFRFSGETAVTILSFCMEYRCSV